MGRLLDSSPTMRRWLVPGPLIALLLVGMVVVALSPSVRETVGFVGIVVGLIGAGILFIIRSRPLTKRERGAWLAMAGSVIAVGTGVLTVGLVTEAGVDLPAFGALDGFFLAGYATLVFALTRLARAEGEGPDWLLTMLDGLVGAIALSALVWTAFFSEMVASLSAAPWWELAIAVTYPVLDVAAVIALMILVIRRSHFHLDLRLAFLAVGLSFQVLADFTFLSSGVGSTFAQAQPAWILNLAATTLLLTTAALVDRTPRKREFPEAATPMWALVWPYLLAGGLLGVHVVHYRTLNPGINEIVLLDAVLAVGAVIFLRQVAVIYRNRVRVEQQRSELVGSVSHELRTPLTAMVGYLALLEDDPDEFSENARREMISEASTQARHMSRLVSDLLMLAKGDRRRFVLELSDVSVSSLVLSTLKTVESDHTSIEERIENDVTVRVDADRVQQALGNMLSNAVRYGGDRALVLARVDGADLVIEVHDSGTGVPTRYEAMIWNRFERGAHRLDAVTPGLGIGLSIVEAVADSHLGKALYRRSELLDGACFSILIPGCVISTRVPSTRVEVSP